MGARPARRGPLADAPKSAPKPDDATSTARSPSITGGNSGHRQGDRGRARGRWARTSSIAARNPTRRPRRAVAEIETAQPARAVEMMPLDLASFASVRAFADAFAREHDRLDVLVNNAGVILQGPPHDRRRARDAVPGEPPEPLPAHEPAARPARRERAGTRRDQRLVRRAPLRAQAASTSTTSSRRAGTARSVYLRAHEAHEHPVHARAAPAARRHGSPPTRCIPASSRARSPATATPGSWATSAWCSAGRSRSPEVGAHTSIYVASSPQLDGVTGQYFAKCRLAKPARRRPTTPRPRACGTSANSSPARRS